MDVAWCLVVSCFPHVSQRGLGIKKKRVSLTTRSPTDLRCPHTPNPEIAPPHSVPLNHHFHHGDPAHAGRVLCPVAAPHAIAQLHLPLPYSWRPDAQRSSCCASRVPPECSHSPAPVRWGRSASATTWAGRRWCPQPASRASCVSVHTVVTDCSTSCSRHLFACEDSPVFPDLQTRRAETKLTMRPPRLWATVSSVGK